MTRRTDIGLRQAISNIERMMMADPEMDRVLSRCLYQLLSLFKSPNGYVFECYDTTENHIPWQLAAYIKSNNGVLTEEDFFTTSSFIPEDLKSKLLAGRIIVETEFEDSAIPFPKTDQPIKNCIVVPIVDAKRIHAVFVLFDTPKLGDHLAEIQNRLRPFNSACLCLLNAIEKRRVFQAPKVFPPTISDHPEQLLGVLDSLFNSVIIVNQDDLIVICNQAAAALLSTSRRNMIGSNISEFLPRGAPYITSRLKAQLNGSNTNHKSARIWRGVPAVTAEQKNIIVDLSAFEIRDGDRQLLGIVLNDISDRLKSTSEYHETLQRFQVITNLAPVAILQLNRDWECTYVNDTWCDYCQMTPDETEGTGWINGVHRSDIDQVLNELRVKTNLEGKYEGEFRLVTPLGRIIWVKANACSLYSEEGEISGLIITFHDITEHLRKEEKLKDIAEKDQLTGLINRTLFNDRLEIALSGVSRFGAVALMFIDLDEFKMINDTMGHDAGDELLKVVASRFRKNIRKVDTIARIGGDEFTVILTSVTNTHSITSIADKLIESLQEPIYLSNKCIYVTCSIGIAVAEDSKTNSKSLLKYADSALYRAKDSGRNQYKFYTEELDKNAHVHIRLKQSIRENANRDFHLVFQPQVNVKTGDIVGLEALARWSHPDLEPIGPSVFIKMIEESGLIKDFSEWLLTETFSTMKRWQDQGLMDGIRVSINLSAKQFRDKSLATYLYQKAREHDIAPKSVILEVTETALIDDSSVTQKTLNRLASMGFDLSLDDFGTGYSSLSYLRTMPLKGVKIDRSFTKDVLHDDEDAKIVTAIIQLAGALELDLVAEGVENVSVMEWLKERHCYIHQGFHFYEPLIIDDTEQELFNRMNNTTTNQNVIRLVTENRNNLL